MSFTVPNPIHHTGIPGAHHPLPPSEDRSADDPKEVTAVLNQDGTASYTSDGSPVFGGADAEHIWAFKSTMLAGTIALANAIAKDLDKTVHDGIDRPAWAKNIADALGPMQAALDAAVKVCDETNPDSPKAEKPQ